MHRKIEFFKHDIREEDIELANSVMRSVFLTTGPNVEAFEKKFAAYLGTEEVVGVTSCTGALHLALRRCGVKAGDEVITTPMTFVATATSILEVGAVPVFVDVCPQSGLLLPGSVEKAINEKTKAILPVHLYGRMVDMKAFNSLAKKYNLALIEDAAHAIESERDGIKPGELSDAACFSFYATKGMTCGEGGAIACNSSEDAGWYRSARHHGISKNASYRYTKGYQHWDMNMMGWKYNMDDIQAALLINQIDRLDDNRQRRQELEYLYRKNLSDIPYLDFIEAPFKDEQSGHHLFTILLPDHVGRDYIINELQSKGIGCAVNYISVHNLTYFKETHGYLEEDYPVSNRIGKRTITLPLYHKLKEEDVVYICDILRNLIG
jgi:dTDP-4-amino-4,6-dideoxygalactose transaminase